MRKQLGLSSVVCSSHAVQCLPLTGKQNCCAGSALQVKKAAKTTRYVLQVPLVDDMQAKALLHVCGLPSK